MMLTPATCVLAIPMYNQRKILKQNLAAILIGTFLGALSSILSVTLLCRIFGLNELITRSLLPKSVTTPIAVSVCEVSGGLPAITVAAVILTGILGSIVIPLLFAKLKIKTAWRWVSLWVRRRMRWARPRRLRSANRKAVCPDWRSGSPASLRSSCRCCCEHPDQNKRHIVQPETDDMLFLTLLENRGMVGA